MNKVFISYSHDSEVHKNRVQSFSNRLRESGINVIIDADMAPGGPPEGWLNWSQKQVEEADRVLIVCTEGYRRRYESNEDPGKGLGVVFEARIIRQALYNTGGYNEKFRVIIFLEEDNNCVPTELQAYQRFLLYKSNDYNELIVWLQGVEQIPAAVQDKPPPIEWPFPETDYPWQLADRKDVFTLFQEMSMGQSSERILLLHGASNIGKTVLLAELCAYAQHLKLPTASLDFKGCLALDDLFETLRLDLGQRILTQSYLASGTSRFYNLIADLQNLRAPLLLVFDTYEQASGDAQNWLESQFLARIEQAPAVIVVIGGQRIPEHHKYRWQVLAKLFELKPIQGVEDWLEYSERKWQCPQMNFEHVKALTLATGGIPGQVSALLAAMVQGLQD